MLIQILTNFISCEFKKIKTNLTMFLIFFWIIWFSQILAISTMFMSLPDITDIPTVTVTELPLEVLQQPQNTLDSVIIDDGGDRSSEERVNRTIEVIPETEEEIQKGTYSLYFFDR
ncbi:uncharacterized protein LOC119615153 [Lucilia sericata]|uniref:uncharacterized protein LOC119615153 n=1 Tax=Lucilia sericata TaxID=13632 RepID=UPI0018A7ED1C|nr:uncharacterized protein LOC119615153 [Lucilia sericata]